MKPAYGYRHNTALEKLSIMTIFCQWLASHLFYKYCTNLFSVLEADINTCRSMWFELTIYMYMYNEQRKIPIKTVKATVISLWCWWTMLNMPYSGFNEMGNITSWLISYSVRRNFCHFLEVTFLNYVLSSWSLVWHLHSYLPSNPGSNLTLHLKNNGKASIT